MKRRTAILPTAIPALVFAGISFLSPSISIAQATAPAPPVVPTTAPPSIQPMPSGDAKVTVGTGARTPGNPAEAPPVAASPVETAHRAAMESLRRDVLQAPFSTEMTIGQAAGRLGAMEALDASIQTAEQPGGPRWRDKVCEVRVELPGTAVASVLWDADRKKQGALGITSEAMDRRITQLKGQRYSGVGIYRPETPQPVVVPGEAMKQRVHIPTDPPPWVGRQMDADGRGAGSGLKGARAAESVALSQLRQQVDALPLQANLTIGQAATKDPRLGQVVAQALRNARVSRVIYGPDEVDVRVSFDLDHVWRGLLQSE